MAIFGNFFKNLFYQEPVNEALKPFKNKSSHSDIQGEGFEDIRIITGFGNTGTGSFNIFYDREINKELKTDREKINEYRKMYEMPEIGDVVENAALESTQEDENGNIITLEFKDEELEKNENIKKNINIEFEKLFKERVKFKKVINDWFITLLVDGKVFLENIINKNKPSLGVLSIKKLPTHTMDYDLDPVTGRVIYFYQFLSDNAKKPKNLEEAEQSDKIVVFYPDQITFIDSGIYGKNKKDVLGYLHKCRQPFNQLRLLETSVVIYRLIRSPERLVFKIDTGNMPKDKAMKYVEKIKNKFTNKQVYDPNTGNLANSTDVTSILENYFLAQCLRLNTKISLVNNQEKTLQEIIDDFNNGIKHQVYTVNQKTGKIDTGEIEWAGITRKNADLIRVWLENDQYIDVTPDHKFCVWENETKTSIIEVEAQNLTDKMELVENDI